MKILLDAYFDSNFGDDLFVHLLMKRYPEALFYTFWRKTPADVLKRAAQLPGLVILPDNCTLQECLPFDAYVMVGGDVLPDGVDYTQRIARMRNVKSNGGCVAMLGFSLYQEYSEKTIRDLQTMAELADYIVIRDSFSAERFRNLVPGAEVTEAADMVFTADIAGFGTIRRGEEPLLGMVIRRKLYSTQEQHMAYCRGMAQVADAYLERNSAARVRFLAFSTGEYDDRVTAGDIIGEMQHGERTEIVSHEGDIASFAGAVAECSAMVTTRFHGLVFALLYHIPFVPVPYEVKVTQLLDELSYQGVRLPYGEELSPLLVQQAAEGMEKFGVSDESLLAYEGKAAVFFAEMDKWYEENKGSCRTQRLTTVRCALKDREQQALLENEELKRQITERDRQVEELEKWIEALKQEREGFERQNKELEELRSRAVTEGQKQAARFNEKIEELTGLIYAAQTREEQQQSQLEELEKWIASLKRERQQFERQNRELEEIRKWQWEQLMKFPRVPAKVEKEYRLYLMRLREELDKQFNL